MTFCPGKTQPAASTGGWARDLALDLDIIATWGASAVVTTLGQEVARQHMNFVHLPIPDGSVPGTAFEAAWVTAGEGQRARLRDGASVLLHCKGGLGRTGMIAARLLIELGVPQSVAVECVRLARPGAIENVLQLAHVHTASVLPEPSPALDSPALEDRAAGALLGLAVGDALGTTLEFQPRDDAAPRLVDIVGGGPFSLPAGCWTDDTSMALALAKSLLAFHPFDSKDLMRRFLSWWQTSPYSPTRRCFDIGGATRAALSRFKANGDPMSGSTDPDSAGSGSLMRLAPVAIRHWKNVEERRALAAEQSRCTHAAAEAVDTCVLYSDLIGEAIAGGVDLKSWRRAILTLHRPLPRWPAGPREVSNARKSVVPAMLFARLRRLSGASAKRLISAKRWCSPPIFAKTPIRLPPLPGNWPARFMAPQPYRRNAFKTAWGDRIEDNARRLFRAGAICE